jgi:two-component system, sensor histidine kinase and response regulator
VESTSKTRSPHTGRGLRALASFLAAGAVLIVAAALIAGCGSSGGTSGGSASPEASGASAAAVSLTAEEQAWLDQKGTLKVGAFNDYPPYGFVDKDGEAIGISADYWRLLGEKLGVGVEFFPVLFSDQIDGLKSGTYDSLQGIFPLASREEWFAFSTPFFDIPTRIFTDGATGITSLDDLKGMKVAVVKDDSGQQVADDAGLETLVVPGYRDAVKAVGEGRASAAILDQLVGEYYARQLGYDDKVQAVGAAVADGKMTLPVQKDDTMLLGILEKAQQMVGQQEIDGIVSKWSST